MAYRTLVVQCLLTALFDVDIVSLFEEKQQHGSCLQN